MNSLVAASARPVPSHSLPVRIAAIVAVVLLVVQAPFFLASGLLAPGWAVAVLIASWIGLVFLAAVWIRRHPARVIALPFVAAAVWFGAITLGERLLGWTA